MANGLDKKVGVSTVGLRGNDHRHRRCNDHCYSSNVVPSGVPAQHDESVAQPHGGTVV